MSNSPRYLHRYIDLTELLDILKNKRVVLRDPRSWEDKNDYFLLEQYAESKNFENIFLSCFTTEMDKYHFWKIYANKPSGVCIQFLSSGITEAISNDLDPLSFSLKEVQYRTLKDVSQNQVDIEEYPFIKRMAFMAEKEFRLFYATNNKIPYRALAIDLSCINEIVLSPYLRAEYVSDIKQLISQQSGLSCKVRKSTILQSASWQLQMTY